MSLPKIRGWLTFLVGIVIIGSTLYFTYNIFTGKSAIPQIFKSTELELQDSTQGETAGLEGELQRMLSEQIKGLIPFESMTKFANLAVWTIGAWILIFGGSKISELGIKLISVPSHQES